MAEAAIEARGLRGIAPHVLALHPALTSTGHEIFEMVELLELALEESAHAA